VTRAFLLAIIGATLRNVIAGTIEYLLNDARVAQIPLSRGFSSGIGSGSFGSALENAFETALEPTYNDEKREA
jgi:hypothetical protein